MTTECLNSSLTPLDWVKEVRPGASAPGVDGGDRLASGPQYVKPPRKPPPVPIDLNANLDAMEARHYRFVDEKPPYSYASLIIFAINSSVQRRMTLSQIYDWIASNFIYYKDAHTGWKNSIRHNLSLNKCFRKVSRPKGETGKGSYWEIDHGAIPQRSPETDKPPLTPDSSAGSDAAKISPGPSPTLTELNRSAQHNSSLSSNELSPYPYWDPSSPGASRTTSSFYPSSSNPTAGLFATPPHHPGVHDSGAYHSPQTAFSDLNTDISESFNSFYHTLSGSLGLSDFFKLVPNDPSLGASSCGHSMGLGVSQHLSNLMQLAEDIHVTHGLEASKVEELSQVFSKGQHNRFGLANKEFDVLAGSFRKFISNWRKTPQSSMRMSSLPSWPPPVTQTTSAYGYDSQSVQTVSAYMYEPPPQSLSQVNQYLAHPSTIQATAVTTYPYTAEGTYTQHHDHHQLYLTPATTADYSRQRSSPLLAADPNFDSVPIPESSMGVPVEALEPTFRPESPEYFDDGFEKAFQDACS